MNDKSTKWWRVAQWDKENNLVVLDENNVPVADCTNVLTRGGLDKANARLIAAAPELLAALQAAERAMLASLQPEDQASIEAIKQARAAIAKAKGAA